MNIYETKAVQKYIVKKDNPSFKNTAIELNSRILIVGASGSGKTNTLAQYLMNSNNTFNTIHVCYKDTEPIYQAMGDQLKDKIKFYTNPADIPPLKDIRKDNKGKQNETDNILLIIDDWVNEAHKFPNLGDIFIRGRKFITTIFITQSYFKVPKTWRSQLTYIILLKLSSDKDLRLVLSDYSLGLDINELQQMYKKSTAEKFHFFKLDINASDANKKYSHNFLDFYKVE